MILIPTQSERITQGSSQVRSPARWDLWRGVGGNPHSYSDQRTQRRVTFSLASEGPVLKDHSAASRIIGEQFGFVGVALALGLFAVLAFTCLGVARRAENRGQCFVAASFGWFLAWHVFMPAGAISGLAPATGFSLPLSGAARPRLPSWRSFCGS